MSAPRVTCIRPGELAVWCALERNPTLRKELANEVKALFKAGASAPSLLWWVREEEAVLARLLWIRSGEGLVAGRLELPWTGAWRGVLRHLLAGMLPALGREGHTRLEIGVEALGDDAPLSALGRELVAAGFAPAPTRSMALLERMAGRPGGRAELPAGAELDGDDGGVWRLAALPDGRGLEGGLAALAGLGARHVRLEWEGDPAGLPAAPAPWEERARRALPAWILAGD